MLRDGLVRGRGQSPDEIRLVSRLRAGDEETFVELVQQHHQVMVRLARSYVPSQSVAEEVVQETWVAALHGLPSFEGRSSVKNWLYAILLNRARQAGQRERRHVPIRDPEHAPDRGRFNRDGSWSHPPAQWVEEVEDRVRAEQLTKSIQIAIDELPAAQREVLTLRDVEGLTAADACQILGLRQGHQRVLLHRARISVRSALEREFGENVA